MTSCVSAFDLLNEKCVPQTSWDIPTTIPKKIALEILGKVALDSRHPMYEQSLRFLIRLALDVPYQVFHHSRSKEIMAALLDYCLSADVNKLNHRSVQMAAFVLGAASSCSSVSDQHPSVAAVLARWFAEVVTKIRDHDPRAPFHASDFSSMTWCNPRGHSSCTCGLARTAVFVLFAAAMLSRRSAAACECLRMFCADVLPFVYLQQDELLWDVFLLVASLVPEPPGARRLFVRLMDDFDKGRTPGRSEQVFLANTLKHFKNCREMSDYFPALTRVAANALSTALALKKNPLDILLSIDILCALASATIDAPSDATGQTLVPCMFSSGLLNLLFQNGFAGVVAGALHFLEALPAGLFEACKPYLLPEATAHAVAAVLKTGTAIVKQHTRWLDRIIQAVVEWDAGTLRQFFTPPELLCTVLFTLQQWASCKNSRLYSACLPGVLELMGLALRYTPDIVFALSVTKHVYVTLGRLALKTTRAVDVLAAGVHAADPGAISYSDCEAVLPDVLRCISLPVLPPTLTCVVAWLHTRNPAGIPLNPLFLKKLSSLHPTCSNLDCVSRCKLLFAHM